MPERTPLNAKVTGQLDRGDYVVEKIYFESIPGAYVIGNLYRPAVIKEKLPAVLYLCGHTKGKVSPTGRKHGETWGHDTLMCGLDFLTLDLR